MKEEIYAFKQILNEFNVGIYIFLNHTRCTIIFMHNFPIKYLPTNLIACILIFFLIKYTMDF